MKTICRIYEEIVKEIHTIHDKENQPSNKRMAGFYLSGHKKRADDGN